MPQIKLPAPYFEEVLVADNLQDGYWIEAVDITGDGRPDLVASGLAVGDVVWYENPSWQERPVASFPKPVALHHADVDGDGRMDLAVCHDYGQCMYNCRPEDGKISWLKNPGTFEANGSSSPWDAHFIADLMATHRLLFGFFTQTENLELMALPVVGPEGVHEPIRVMLYPVPEDPKSARDGWDGQLVDGSSFRVIHGLAARKFGSRNGLDSLLVASEEGVSWLYYDEGWHNVLLGEGETGQAQTTGFKGTGNVAVGKIDDDPYAYIATVEPFHGNTVAVYTKEDAGSTLADAGWKRTVLDVYGDPNDAGEGPGHHVVTADFDGDGDDEFLVALRGPMPWQGVFYYKAVDLQNGLFVKKRVSTASAARIAVADFDGDGRLDFATTGYYTPGYFLADDPKIVVFLNRFADAPASA